MNLGFLWHFPHLGFTVHSGAADCNLSTNPVTQTATPLDCSPLV